LFGFVTRTIHVYHIVRQHFRQHSVLKFEHEIRTFGSMKIDLKYVNDSKGQTTAVQLSLTEWEKILSKLKKFEEAFKVKSDLKEAFEQVDILKKSKGEKQTLKDFLNEL
jgi:hypothetical protein